VRFPHPETSRLVIVGPSDYDHDSLENLPAVANCSGQLHTILTDRETGGFLPQNCLVSDGNLEPQRLADRIQKITSEAEDVLALWLIGHGLLDIETRRLHFALKATNPENLYYTALPFDLLRRAIIASPAVIKVLMLDCCFSGRAIAEMAMAGSGGVEEVVRAEVAVEGTCIVTACSGREIALAPPGGKYTAFTGAALEVLEANAPLPVGEMVGQVSRLLQGRQHPLPHLASTETAADLALVRHAGRPPGQAAPRGLQVTVIPAEAEGLRASEALGVTGTALAQGIAAAVRRADPEPRESSLRPVDADAREAGMRQLRASAEEEAGSEKEIEPEVAIAALRKAITEMIPLGGNVHPLTLAVRDLQGFWLSRAERYLDAVRIFTRVAQARTDIYGPEHPFALASRHNLAHAMGLAGDIPGAVSQFITITEERKRILGDRHPDTLLSTDGLAYWTAVSGDTLKAVTIYQALYEDEDWQSGPDDERTLRRLSRLGWARGLNQDLAGARDSYSDLAERWASLEGAESTQARKYAEFRDHWAARMQSEH
jgi:hypothetical protein